MTMFPDLGNSGARDINPDYLTKISPTGEGHVNRYRKSLHPRWVIRLSWNSLTPAQAQAVDDHVLAHAAAFAAFDWFEWTPAGVEPAYWLWVPIAKGDGGTTAFTLPARNVTDLALFTGTGTATTPLTIANGAGAQGETVVQLQTAPPAGHWLWGNFRGERRFTVTFADDSQPLTRHLETGLYAFETLLITEKRLR